MAADTNNPATPAVTTLDRTIIAGQPRRQGLLGSYRRLAYGLGEQRMIRTELGSRGSSGSGVTSLWRLVHLSDFQLPDVKSPGRFEFFEELRGQPRAGTFVPAQRPQESIVTHAVEAMARTIRQLPRSDQTGAALSLALCTGDSLDNAQLNELGMFISLLSGGIVRLGSGGPSFEGVQSFAWHQSPLFWHPDPGNDEFKRDWGFPDHPGLLEEAMQPFDAAGIGIPWLSCFGNHDGLVLGTSIPTLGYRQLVLGKRKAIAAPSGMKLLDHEAELLSHPERFLIGSAREVAADPERRIVGRYEFVQAHLRASGLPAGHGFDRSNLEQGTAYAVFDELPATRLILLDTTNLDGYHHGSIGHSQLEWLEERLVEVHSRFLSADGRWSETGHQDRLVVLASHHGLATLTNTRQDPGGAEEDHPRATTDEVRCLLHRFPNVVLWLNGHRHLNQVKLWPSPHDPNTGIWEVSTAAMADWPCQARVVELVVTGEGRCSVLCTMLDHAAEPDPDESSGLWRLASVHRELAANIPVVGVGSGREGDASDRNVELVLNLPFRF